MYIPKRYGQSRVDNCPFCQRQATTKNEQGVPVCVEHKKSFMPDLKCVCGGYLDIMHGKFGVFFNCIKCGNMNMRKALEINEGVDLSGKTKEEKVEKKKNPTSKPIKKKSYFQNSYSSKPTRPNQQKEITIRSDDPMYFD